MKKIPFDIKYRTEIESGKYKVETKSGRPVKIIYWERQGDMPIIGIVSEHRFGNDFEIIDTYRIDGTSAYEGAGSLIIVTDEPAMSELEYTLYEWLVEDTGHSLSNDEYVEIAKIRAFTILGLVKKELQNK